MMMFEPVARPSSEILDLVVHVIAAVPLADLDEGDLDDFGNCAALGKYRIGIDLCDLPHTTTFEACSSVLDRMLILYEPSLFRVIVSTFNSAIDTRVIRHLGSWMPTGRAPSPSRQAPLYAKRFIC